jgi:hypothetical protein
MICSGLVGNKNKKEARYMYPERMSREEEFSLGNRWWKQPSHVSCVRINIASWSPPLGAVGTTTLR